MAKTKQGQALPDSGDSSQENGMEMEPSLPARKRGGKSKQAPSGPASLTQFEKYEIVEVDRKDIVNAPYNPRRISDKAKKRLRENISKVGLLEPIIWNRKTGHIVGGHQRIAALDSLEKNQHYKVRVAAVDLELNEEKQQNIFLNNPNAQGEFDLESLASVIKEEGIDFESAGFSPGDIYQMFGEDVMADKPKELVDMMQAMRDARDSFESGVAASIEEDGIDDRDFYVLVVFRDNNQRDLFVEAVGASELRDARYIDGRDLWDFMYRTGAADGRWGPTDEQPTEEQAQKIRDYHELPEVDCKGNKLTKKQQDALFAEAVDFVVERPDLVDYYARRAISGYECQRCGKTHRLVVLPMAKPMPHATHWGKCPNTNEPIVLDIPKAALPPLLAGIHTAARAAKAMATTPHNARSADEGDYGGDDGAE